MRQNRLKIHSRAILGSRFPMYRFQLVGKAHSSLCDDKFAIVHDIVLSIDGS